MSAARRFPDNDGPHLAALACPAVIADCMAARLTREAEDRAAQDAVERRSDRPQVPRGGAR